MKVKKLILSPFEKKIAFRYLFSQKKEGFISFFALFSFLGIMLGVATLIIVMSVMNGFRENLLSSIIGMRPHIMGFVKGEKAYLNNADIQKIKETKGIQGVYPMIEKQNILTFKGQAQGVLVQALKKEDLILRTPLQESLTKKNTNDFFGYHIIIGKALAKNFNIKIGDSLLLMTPEGNETAFGTIPRQRSFKVIDIFEYGMNEYDKNYIFMPLETAQSFYKLKDELHFLGIFTHDISSAETITKFLNHLFDDKYFFVDWKHQDQAIFHAVEVEKNVMFLILTLIILIAGFNITSSLVMLVKDKTKAIGILKTMGASDFSIGKIFITIGLFIGSIGTLLGIMLGILVVQRLEQIRLFLESLMGIELFSAEIYYLTKLPAVLAINDVVAVSIIAIFLSFIASFFPARKATKMTIIEAIHS